MCLKTQIPRNWEEIRNLGGEGKAPTGRTQTKANKKKNKEIKKRKTDIMPREETFRKKTNQNTMREHSLLCGI